MNIKGKRAYLGWYDTAEEAHLVYVQEKSKHIISVLSDYPDKRVKQAILSKMENVLCEV